MWGLGVCLVGSSGGGGGPGSRFGVWVWEFEVSGSWFGVWGFGEDGEPRAFPGPEIRLSV